MEATRTLNREQLEQYVLAGSKNTSQETLRNLAKHQCAKVRMRVAENPCTPAEILQELVDDPEPDVIMALVINQSCPDSLKSKIASNDDILLRHGLAQNIETPRFILQELARDENCWVRGEALKTLRILDSKNDDEVGRRRTIKRERSRESLVERMSEHRQNEVAS